MFYETARNDHGLPFNPLKACVIPRPIGWITSMSAKGRINLAPFSFFNMLSYNPAFVMFSAGGHTVDEEKKDSVAFIEETGEFVYNMATWDTRQAMSETSLILDREVDELAAVGLTPAPCRLVKPPRVLESPVNYECRLHQIVVLPGKTKHDIHHMIIGEVIGVHIRDSVIANGKVDATLLKPIARLGYKEYVVVDKVFEMEKATPEERIKPAHAAE